MYQQREVSLGEQLLVIIPFAIFILAIVLAIVFGIVTIVRKCIGKKSNEEDIVSNHGPEVSVKAKVIEKYPT